MEVFLIMKKGNLAALIFRIIITVVMIKIFSILEVPLNPDDCQCYQAVLIYLALNGLLGTIKYGINLNCLPDFLSALFDIISTLIIALVAMNNYHFISAILIAIFTISFDLMRIRYFASCHLPE